MFDSEKALEICQNLVEKRKLPIKVFSATQDDKGEITFFFSAPKRVDFRKLALDLNTKFGTSVRLYQAGPRKAAQVLSGVGKCGKALCCATWLKKIPKVPTKLIEEQNLEGGPSAYTGICGKLLCCLLFETKEFKCPHVKKPKEEKSVEPVEPSVPSVAESVPPVAKSVAKKRRIRRLVTK